MVGISTQAKVAIVATVLLVGSVGAGVATAATQPQLFELPKQEEKAVVEASKADAPKVEAPKPEAPKPEVTTSPKPEASAPTQEDKPEPGATSEPKPSPIPEKPAPAPSPKPEPLKPEAPAPAPKPTTPPPPPPAPAPSPSLSGHSSAAQVLSAMSVNNPGIFQITLPTTMECYATGQWGTVSNGSFKLNYGNAITIEEVAPKDGLRIWKVVVYNCR